MLDTALGDNIAFNRILPVFINKYLSPEGAEYTIGQNKNTLNKLWRVYNPNKALIIHWHKSFIINDFFIRFEPF